MVNKGTLCKLTEQAVCYPRQCAIANLVAIHKVGGAKNNRFCRCCDMGGSDV